MARVSEPLAQRVLAGMAERRVADVVRQAGHLYRTTDIERRIAVRQQALRLHHRAYTVAQATANAGHFHAMGEPVVGVVVRRQRVNLGLAPQTAEGAGKHHAVVVDVEIAAQAGCAFQRGRVRVSRISSPATLKRRVDSSCGQCMRSVLMIMPCKRG